MDGIGYGNWNSQNRRHTGGDLEDSYDSSSPPTYTSDPYGFETGSDTGNTNMNLTGGQRRSAKSFSNMSLKKDSYDFNLTAEESFGTYSSDGTGSPATMTKSKPQLSRRMSTEERMAEILKNNQKPVDTSVESANNETAASEEEEDIHGAWKSSWNQLMEGLDTITSPKNASLNKSVEPSPPPPVHSRRSSYAGQKLKSDTLNSSDSFDISEADFEVGTHASRRSQEMLEDRRRKSMANVTGSGTLGGDSVSFKQKFSESPEIHKKSEMKQQKAHFSAAGISSIDPDENFGDESEENLATEKGFRKYGSMGGKSDGDLLKVLAETKETFRYPLTPNSSGSVVDHFSPKNGQGITPPSNSKRRQKMLEMRRSVSPTPGKSLNEKLQSMQLKSQAKFGKSIGSDDDNGYDPSHTGDYSMDDFEVDTPMKRRTVSCDTASSITDLPKTEPPLVKSVTAPLPSRVLTKEEEDEKRRMDEIKNRWSSMTSVNQFFPSVAEETTSAEKESQSGPNSDDGSGAGSISGTGPGNDEMIKSGSPAELISKLAQDSTVRGGEGGNEEISTPPVPETSNDSTSFQSLGDGPPPPPAETDPEDKSMSVTTPSASMSSFNALNKFKSGGQVVVSANRIASGNDVTGHVVKPDSDTGRSDDSTNSVEKSSANAVASSSHESTMQNEEICNHQPPIDERQQGHHDSDDNHEFERSLSNMAGRSSQKYVQQQNYHQVPPPHFYEQHYSRAPPGGGSYYPPPGGYYTSHPPHQQYHHSQAHNQHNQDQGYSSVEQFPWQSPHFHEPNDVYISQGPVPVPAKFNKPDQNTFTNLAGDVHHPASRSSGRGNASTLPIGTEIDPVEFVKQTQPSRKTLHNSRSGNWPSSIPLISPSVTDLHAHIASIHSHTDALAENKKIAQDISLLKKKTLNKSRNSGSYSHTRIARAGSRSNGRKVLDNSGIEDETPPDVVSKSTRKVVDGPKWSAINRIEAGNNRLLQQFEELDREIRELKNKKSTKDLGKTKVNSLAPSDSARLRSSGARGDKHAPVAKKSSIPTGAAARRSRSHSNDRQSQNSKPFQSYSHAHGSSMNILYGDELIDLEDLHNDIPPPPPPEVAGDQQDNDALEAIKSIFRESVDREKILTQREKSLEVRESLLTSTYYANLEKVSEVKPTPTFVNDEELVEENRNLKAEVYELRASQRRGCKPQIIAEAVEESGSATNNSDGESDKYSSDGEYDHNESGDGIEKKKKHKAEKGKDVVKLDRREYETLLKNLSELENVVSLYEKSNERMVTELSDKERIIKNMKVDFFNQQEALVRESNLLKNKLQSGSMITTNVNQTSADHFMACPPPPPHLLASRNGVELKDVLHKEALLQDLHEQVMKMGKLNQEKDKEIALLTARINDLQRESIVMSKTMEQYSAMAAKGKALVDAFYPAPAGKSTSHKSSDGSMFPCGNQGSDLNTQASRSNFLHWDTEGEDADRKTIEVNHKLIEGSESDSDLVTQLRSELHRVQVQSFNIISSLRSRLSWYADNQKLIEGVEEEKKTLETTLLRAENDKDKSSHLNDTSMSSTSRRKTGHRSQSDIRRIKELESALVACRESIQKRFPDSVANLLYANVVGSIPSSSSTDHVASDGHKKTLAEALQESEKYKAQVDIVAAEGEHRLRSLRQEFERMRIGYETSIQKLNMELGLPPVPFVCSKHYGSLGSNNMVPSDNGRPAVGSSPVRSFGQAKQKIQELEVELGRLRSFYTKKVEAMQRKHHGQIAALRRGMPSDSSIAVNSLSGLKQVHETERQELLSRISLLETEVLNSAEELGRMRALNVAACTPAADGSIGQSDNNESTDKITIDTAEKKSSRLMADIEDLKEENANYRLQVKKLEREIQLQKTQFSQFSVVDENGSENGDGAISHAQSKLSVQLPSNNPTLSTTSATITDQLRQELRDQGEKFTSASEEWSKVKSELQLSVKSLRKEKEDMEQDIIDLRKTLLSKDGEIQHWQGESLRLEMVTQQAKTPQMQQFLAMEQQLGMLEARLVRREQELTRVLDESKASGHLERLRLQNIHEQEMREKDEQLLRFEGELEELVAVLHQQQLQQ